MVSELFVAVDVGGTKIEVATATVAASVRLGDVGRFSTEKVDDFGVLLRDFIKGHNPKAVVIGVAGPVLGRRVQLTNVPFVIDADQVQHLLGCPVALINDLEAHGWGIGALAPEQILTIQQGEERVGNRALIAAGTGLGEAILFWDGHRHVPSASEGGHATFGPASSQDIPFLQYMLQKYDHVSWERVVSGIDGFRDILGFLITSRHFVLPPEDAETISRAESIGPVITAAAQAGKPYAVQAVEMFVRFYGAEAGNLALKSMAVGGVYIAGSIVHKVMPWMQSGVFVKAFAAKGRFGSMLANIPIRIVNDPYSALRGAAVLASRIAQSN